MFNFRVAEEKKTQGNENYKAQNYTIALKYYTEAISLCPETAAYYGNRSGNLVPASTQQNVLTYAL